MRKLLIAMLAGAMPLLALANEVATVIGVRGQASVTQGGHARPVEKDLAIEAGAVIRTEAAGRVKLRFADGSVVVVGDASAFRVDHMTLDAAGKRSSAGFVLDIGLVGQVVAPGPSGSWSVRTPTAVTAVRGTEFVVEVTADRLTEVQIRAGQVVVEPVAPPKGVRLPMGLPPARPVALDQARSATVCDPATYLCGPARALTPERLRAIDDRLSGV